MNITLHPTLHTALLGSQLPVGGRTTTAADADPVQLSVVRTTLDTLNQLTCRADSSTPRDIADIAGDLTDLDNLTRYQIPADNPHQLELSRLADIVWAYIVDTTAVNPQRRAADIAVVAALSLNATQWQAAVAAVVERHPSSDRHRAQTVNIWDHNLIEDAMWFSDRERRHDRIRSAITAAASYRHPNQPVADIDIVDLLAAQLDLQLTETAERIIGAAADTIVVCDRARSRWPLAQRWALNRWPHQHAGSHTAWHVPAELAAIAVNSPNRWAPAAGAQRANASTFARHAGGAVTINQLASVAELAATNQAAFSGGDLIDIGIRLSRRT